MSELPRGLRNRNPGNIRRSAVRYKGETESDDAAFKAFASTAWGYRAMFVLLHTYRVRHRIATLRGMIARWPRPRRTTRAPICAPSSGEAASTPTPKSTPATARP